MKNNNFIHSLLVLATAYILGFSTQKLIKTIHSDNDKLIEVSPSPSNSLLNKKIHKNINKWSLNSLENELIYYKSIPFKEALEIIKNLDSDCKDRLFYILFLQWSEENFDEAFTIAATIGESASNLRKELFSEFSQKNPLGALAFLQAQEDTLEKNHNYYSSLALHWSKQNFTQAFKIYEEHQLLDLNTIEIFAKNLFDSKNGSKEINVNLNLLLNSNFSGIENVIIEHWSKIDPLSSKEWIQNQKLNFKDKEYYFLKGLSHYNLKEATLLLQNLPLNDQKKSITPIFNSLSEVYDSEFMFQWLSNAGFADKINNIALLQIRRWANENRSKALKWIDNINESETKYAALDFYIKSLPDNHNDSLLYNILNKLENIEQKKILINKSRFDKKNY